ncbi:MAG: hypothetical protein F4142_08670 [Nitrospira sp. SB0675_bin_23]|nr:hypothetical protein [Nitrospira sp. SB0675_bin_23]
MAKKIAKSLEEQRLAMQGELDAGKEQAERNRMGQFATPTGLAVDILRYTKGYLTGKGGKVRFIDPALGTGSFYSALLEVFPKRHIAAAVGYEVDPYYGASAAKLWGGSGLDVRLADFTQADPPSEAEKFNLLICNPPYVRHHHIINGEKERLKRKVRDAAGVTISGLATGNNNYFILSADDIERRELPMEAFRPILPSPRYVPVDEIMCDGDGNPLLERRLFLLDPPWTENEIREKYPNLWMYLEEGKADGIADRYICRHRAMWYTQECRPPAPFVCTYLGRSDKKNGKPFRFILNNSNATAANGYLMLYPRRPFERTLLDSPELKRRVWEYLNQICPQAMLGEGRVYGGGLHKLEPNELGNVPAQVLVELFPVLGRNGRGSKANCLKNQSCRP